jgi:hypothetical protein
MRQSYAGAFIFRAGMQSLENNKYPVMMLLLYAYAIVPE